jgi:hypothetical protein
MMAFDAMEPEHMAFLDELYTRSAGDARHGVPYEALIDALGFDERVTKRIQRELEREGLVDLTTVPSMTHMGRPVMEYMLRQHHQQTISMTPQGMRHMEDIFATRADTARLSPSASPHTSEPGPGRAGVGAGADSPRHVCSKPFALAST